MIYVLWDIYLLILVILLFFRYGKELDLSLDAITERLSLMANFKPFHTIRNYITAYRLGNISRTLVTYNLLGNFILFLPFGILLPVVTGIRKRNVLPVILITIISVEILQLITGLGSLDVDDLILNFSGAVLGFICYVLCTVNQKNKKKR